jgi:hypothetical protein
MGWALDNGTAARIVVDIFDSHVGHRQHAEYYWMWELDEVDYCERLFFCPLGIVNTRVFLDRYWRAPARWRRSSLPLSLQC